MEAYFDNSATTRCFEEVKDIVVKTMMEDFGNPSDMHQKGVDAEGYVKESARTLAQILKVTEKEILFTSGGTESNNTALIGTALVVTALNTGAMYIDSVIYNYYSYAYVFGGLVVRIISGAATAVLMVFVAPPVVNLLNRSLDTVRTAQ